MKLFLIKISKEDAKCLNKEYGIKFGEGGISHSYTKNRKYYLCESKYNMNIFRKMTKEKYRIAK